jgi:peptide/nickel transport system substrate-binding protein
MSHRRVPRPQWPLALALLLGVAAIAIIWFIIASPLDPSNNKADDQRYVEAIVGAPARINPLFAPLNETDADISALVFSGLTRLGPDAQVLPDLAQSWEISDDGTTYTFQLRDDVLWHTGVGFTAADAVFTYDLLADPDLPSDPSLTQLWRQVSCQAPAQYTLQCVLPEPFAPFLSFTTIGLLPRHAFEGVTAANIADSPLNQSPAGTGPYRLAQIDLEKAILRASKSYYGQGPNIEEIELRFYPDPSTAAAAINRGDVQGLLLGPSASQEDLNLVTSTGGLRAYTANRTAYTVLFLNNLQPPFDDPALRHAVGLGIDIDAIIGKILGGRAVRADSPMIPGTWAYNPELESHGYDPGRAEELLEQAGWQRGEQGVRHKDGNELRFSLMTDQDPLRIALAEELAGQLSEIGITATVVPESSANLVQDFLVPHQYQAAIFGWDPGPDPDPYPAWHSSQVGPDGSNLSGYQSEEADRIIVEARQTRDLDKREALYYTFQQKFLDDMPSVLLYYPVFTYFVSDSVQNLELGTLFETASRFANVTDWTTNQGSELLGG